MSLVWTKELCATPFGAVPTYHWAVRPDADDDGTEFIAEDDDANRPLEQAEDQLGAVLWNSNTTALNYLCHKVFAASASASASPPPAGPPSLALVRAGLKGKRILELGSGVGVLGIALSVFGGARAAITDIKELVPLMDKNIAVSAACPVDRPASPPSAASASASPSTESGAVALATRPPHGPPVADLCRAFAFRWGDRLPPALAAFICPVDYVVLCDALYGNKSGWPKLIDNLIEIANKTATSTATGAPTPTREAGRKAPREDTDASGKTNAPSVKSAAPPTIINFCEQRVVGVEDGFLVLLRERCPRWVVDGPHVLEECSGLDMKIRVTTITPIL